MRKMWLNLSDEGNHYVVAGQLREGSFELALERLETMVKSGVEVKDWLADMAMYMLLDAGEVEETVHVVQLTGRHRQREISGVIWFRLLDVASSSMNHVATSYVWKRRVQHEHLNPSSGQCLNVLKTAARYGDIDLATDVFRILGQRKTTFDNEHYELLFNTYVRALDFKSAFKLLCVMAEAGMNPDQGCTRLFSKYLRVHPDRSSKCLSILRSLKASHNLPPTALNVLLEANGVFPSKFDETMEWYKDFRGICGAEPNLETFNVMLQKCAHHKKKEAAMFLASEMVALEIKPDRLTYDRLVLICANSGELDDAFGYFLEMQEQGFKPRLGTLVFLATVLAQKTDQRTVPLIEALKAFGAEAEQPLMMITQKFETGLQRR